MESDLKTLEARLNAHREILISLLSEHMQPPERARRLLHGLEQEVLLRDGSEDPGVEPSAGTARGHEKGKTIRGILEAAKDRAEAWRRDAQGT
jgi:hypothetical protein